MAYAGSHLSYIAVLGRRLRATPAESKERGEGKDQWESAHGWVRAWVAAVWERRPAEGWAANGRLICPL